MELMDIFDGDAFSMVTMTTAINKIPYPPNFLGSLGIFTPTPIRTIDNAVSISDAGELHVVQTTPRGSPPIEQTMPIRNIRSFRTPRIAVADTIRASELQNVLSRSVFSGPNMATVLADLQSEIAYRLDGPIGLRSKQETTKERMRLGAIAGIVLDADGTTLYDWPTLFGVSLPAEIPLDLLAVDPAPGTLNNKIRALHRSVLRAAKAGNLPSARVIALCGDNFFDALVNHPDIITAYTFFQNGQVARLQSGGMGVAPFSLFPFGDIDWINYRGTDDNSTIAIDTNKAKFIPVGIPGLFQEVLAPAENFTDMNSPGLPIYVLVIPDRDRNSFVRLETYSYPMYMATRPDVLFSARLGA